MQSLGGRAAGFPRRRARPARPCGDPPGPPPGLAGRGRQTPPRGVRPRPGPRADGEPADRAGPAAERIVAAAVEHLARSVHRVRDPRETSPVVLTGGVLSGSTPVREELVARLASDSAGTEVAMAGCTAGGAAWLAALRAGAAEDDHALHAVFTRAGARDRPGSPG